MELPMWYTLDANFTPVPASALDASKWLEKQMLEKTPYKFVGQSMVRTATGEVVWVSTVFLGMDHGYGMGDPLLWETMVFPTRMKIGPRGGAHRHPDHGKEILCTRYTSHADAKQGHLRTIKLMRKRVPR